ncbi:MAG: response regulator [Candidatus Omnitrophota bacterium]|nr:response regulator [Candidatus Omnitrophota bacterium]
METRKILVVDDEDDVRLFLQDFLSEREFEVSAAASGEEAVSLVRASTPDIVLLDIMMPGMDGLACLEAIKKEQPKTNVIMITALNDDSRIAKAKKLGAYNYILKPFSLGYLESELMRLIDKMQA